MISLLTAAAHDRLEDLRFILAPDATWGLPDRRELEARPVFAGDDGAAFFDALRGAASRFRGVLQGQGGRGANSNCPPMTPGAQEAVRTGAEPYWCYYISDDGLDLLVFRMQVIAGRGRVTYVGLFEQRPETPIHVGRKDPAPPLVPPPPARPQRARGPHPLPGPPSPQPAPPGVIPPAPAAPLGVLPRKTSRAHRRSPAAGPPGRVPPKRDARPWPAART